MTRLDAVAVGAPAAAAVEAAEATADSSALQGEAAESAADGTAATTHPSVVPAALLRLYRCTSARTYRCRRSECSVGLLLLLLPVEAGDAGFETPSAAAASVGPAPLAAAAALATPSPLPSCACSCSSNRNMSAAWRRAAGKQSAERRMSGVVHLLPAPLVCCARHSHSANAGCDTSRWQLHSHQLHLLHLRALWNNSDSEIALANGTAEDAPRSRAR